MASFQDFDKQYLNLLDEVAETIGIALSTAESRERMNALLQETEKQAAELRDKEAILENQQTILYDLNKNLEKNVEIKTREYLTEKEKIQKILDSIRQGILTLDKELKIGNEYSHFVLSLLEKDEKDIVHQNLIDVIFQNSNLNNEQIDIIKNVFFVTFGETEISWELNSGNLPKEITLNIHGQSKIVEMEWTPMMDENKCLSKIILSLRDMTDQRMLEEEIGRTKKAHEETMQIISTILPIGVSKIENFILSAFERIEKIKLSLSQGQFDQVAFHLHTLKGEARLYVLNDMSDTIHHGEGVLKQYMDKEITDLKLVEEQILTIETILLKYQKVTKNILGADGGPNSEKQSSITTLYDLITPQVTSVKKMLENSGCRLAQVNCLDNVIVWEPVILQKIREIIIHMMTNIADHGFILPMKKGKNVLPAVIMIKAQETAVGINIVISDNGYGFDEKKIREVAIQKGIHIENEENILNVLMYPGFSTVESVTKTSGRGVGLSTIKSIMKELGGTIQIKHNEPQGAYFILDFFH